MWRRHIARAFAVILLGGAVINGSVFAGDPVRWIKATKKVPKGAYLMPGDGSVAICAKRGDPGTLMVGRDRICTYINSNDGIPKWTNHYHVLGLGDGAQSVWHPSERFTAGNRGALAKTLGGHAICRVKVVDSWVVGRLIEKDTSCLYSAKEQRNFAPRGKHEILLVPGAAGSARQAPAEKPAVAETKATSTAKPALKPVPAKKTPDSSNPIAVGEPVRWLQARREVPTGAFRIGKEAGSEEPALVCRIRHPRWGWFAGTVSNAEKAPRCDVAVGGRRASYDDYQVLAFNSGFGAAWVPLGGKDAPITAVVVSPQDVGKSHICRAKVDTGVYVVGNLESGECTIPYTAQQTNPVPLKTKFEILLWQGAAAGSVKVAEPPAKNPVKWIASEDDVPPDAFLDHGDGRHYVCRVGDAKRGWRIGTMNRLRDVRQVDGKSVPQARTCYVAEGTGIVHHKKYDVLAFRSGYSGRWKVFSGELPAMSVRGSGPGEPPVYLCGGLQGSDLLSGTLRNGKCTLPYSAGAKVVSSKFRILVGVEAEGGGNVANGEFEGEYRCVPTSGETKLAVFLLITAKGPKSAGGPFKVLMQHGTADKTKFDVAASAQSGIGLYYPNRFGFAKRQMAVAYGAQVAGASADAGTFVALMNLSDSSGDGRQLRMTTLSSELVPSIEAVSAPALNAAKPGVGEGRIWRCQRT